MQFMKTAVSRCSPIMLICTMMAVPGCFAQTTTPPSAPAPSSDAEVAWFWTGRAGFNPNNGNVLPYGFLTVINGLPGSPVSLFTGLPSEQTAMFTFVYSVFQAAPLPADLDQTLFLTTPATFNIYYNPKPSGNWNNPDSFSQGQLVATYSRPGFQGVAIYVTQYQAYSAKLVSSTPFTFNGQTFDFKNIAPGVTMGDYLGVIPGEGFSPDFPLVYSISSYATAIGIIPRGASTAAFAGPRHSMFVTPEFSLDGTKSVSATGTPLKYEWTVAPGSPAAAILRANTATPVVHFGAGPGTYVFKLRVTDEIGNSSADFVQVEYSGNSR